jgi:hypothetical protein
MLTFVRIHVAEVMLSDDLTTFRKPVVNATIYGGRYWEHLTLNFYREYTNGIPPRTAFDPSNFAALSLVLPS